MKNIYICGFESNPEQGGVSGWEWNFSENERDKKHSEFLKLNNCIVYRGVLQVDDTEDLENIDSLVELYLEENDFENAFDDKIYL